MGSSIGSPPRMRSWVSAAWVRVRVRVRDKGRGRGRRGLRG